VATSPRDANVKSLASFVKHIEQAGCAIGQLHATLDEALLEATKHNFEYYCENQTTPTTNTDYFDILIHTYTCLETCKGLIGVATILRSKL